MKIKAIILFFYLILIQTSLTIAQTMQKEFLIGEWKQFTKNERLIIGAGKRNILSFQVNGKCSLKIANYRNALDGNFRPGSRYINTYNSTWKRSEWLGEYYFISKLAPYNGVRITVDRNVMGNIVLRVGKDVYIKEE